MLAAFFVAIGNQLEKHENSLWIFSRGVLPLGFVIKESDL